jgi:hypothetical protein
MNRVRCNKWFASARAVGDARPDVAGLPEAFLHQKCRAREFGASHERRVLNDFVKRQDSPEVRAGAVLPRAKADAQRFLQDRALVAWVTEMNARQGIAPSPGAVVRQRRVSELGTTSEMASGSAMSTSGASRSRERHWLRRWARRWRLRRGRIARGNVVDVRLLQKKVPIDEKTEEASHKM